MGIAAGHGTDLRVSRPVKEGHDSKTGAARHVLPEHLPKSEPAFGIGATRSSGEKAELPQALKSDVASDREDDYRAKLARGTS